MYLLDNNPFDQVGEDLLGNNKIGIEDVAKQKILSYIDMIKQTLSLSKEDIDHAIGLYKRANKFADRYLEEQDIRSLDYAGVKITEKIIGYKVRESSESIKEGDFEQAKKHLEESATVSDILSRSEKAKRITDKRGIKNYQNYRDNILEKVEKADLMLDKGHDGNAREFLADGIHAAEVQGYI